MIFIFELFIIFFIIFGLLLFCRILQNILVDKWRRKIGKKSMNKSVEYNNIQTMPEQEKLLSYWINLNRAIKIENHKSDYLKVVSCLTVLDKRPNSEVVEKVTSIIKNDFSSLIDNYVLCFSNAEGLEIDKIFLENYALLATKIEVLVKAISENAIKEMKIQNKYLKKETD